ncbi:MAG: hypothetical protein RMI34_05395 [Chloroherpetonaceae bacterium]|nr:hypothetical protein [Chloroherpetonaceae bacterium]MCS7211943.1 hypothetical protein [Chloroherpetonaceae bacterium]MDW8019494.1 hypothetical protein [Chloroherpetonaceae bacterium]MDW8466142.1 hypothetical protein [Chloroherpetonaceae bacterium]
MIRRSCPFALFLAAAATFSMLSLSCSSSPSSPSDASGGTASNWLLGGAVTGIVRNLWVDGSTLYATTSSGVFRSTDTARTWTQVVSRTQLGLAGGIEGGLVARGTTLYLGTSDFAFFSVNSGTTWRQIRSGLGTTNSICAGIYLTGNRVFYGSNVGVGFRLNFGDTAWTRAFETGGLHNVQAFFNQNDTLYAGYDIGMQRSFDNGTTWNLAPVTGLPTTAARNVFAFTRRSNSLYIGTNESVYTSNNGGASWSAVSGLPTDDDDVRALTTVGSSVIAGMRFRGVWRSTDGINFTDFNQGLENGARTNVAALATMGNVVVMATAGPSPQIWIRRVQ